MNNYLVSIVMPAYKAEKTVAEAIRSVQAQSCPHWQLLVVDDGSPDGTADVVAELAKSDPRIELVRQANSGPAMARQKPLDHARGRYIAFLHSDDLWLPGKLERQLAFMAEHRAALSYTAFRRIQADGSGSGQLISIPPRLTYRALLGNTAIATAIGRWGRRRPPARSAADRLPADPQRTLGWNAPVSPEDGVRRSVATVGV